MIDDSKDATHVEYALRLTNTRSFESQRSRAMPYRRLAARIRAPVLPPMTEPAAGDGKPLSNVFEFSLTLVGDLPIPGVTVARLLCST
jgi:hypothetical protein